jgi:hypothetical protein
MRPRLVPLLRCSSILLATVLAAGGLAAQSTLLYASDFETDGGGFAVVSGEWEHGAPTGGPGGVHSGAKCWATDLGGDPAATPVLHLLESPPIDASSAAGADAILVSWWQHLDEQPLLFPYPNYTAYAFANGTGFHQDLFGRWHDGMVNPPYAGWLRMTALLGPEHAVPDLTLSFRWQGANCAGFSIDDVTVEALSTTTVAAEDFEAGPAGFTGTWQHGAPSGCPLPATAASGAFCLGTGITFCSHGLDQTLQGALVDAAPAGPRIGLTTGLYEVLVS